MKVLATSVAASALLLSPDAAAESDDREQPMCSIYLAPSSPGNAGVSAVAMPSGMGVFAGVDFAPGAEVGHPDIVIPIVDVRAQIGTRRSRFAAPGEEERGGHRHRTFDWHWSDYVWEPRALGAAGEGIDAKAAAPGLGTLVRGSTLVEPNVVPTRAAYDAAGLHRSRDPNAGSISYYHGMKTVATKPIEAGTELFSDFGMHYYSDREGSDSSFSADPDAQHDDAHYQALVDGHGDALGAVKGGAMDNLWGVLWDSSSPLKRPLHRVIPNVWDRPVGGVTTASSGSNGNHSTEWLSTHGYCLDNIRPGMSKLDSAGRGAFAARPIPAGSVISPAPVVHLPDRDVLDMRAPRSDAPDDASLHEILSDEVAGRQLLLNYCFGHPESTMLLCTVGAITGLINHAPSGVAEPNAKIRWSSSDMSNSSWLNMTLDELDGEHSIGLVLEYVALRDISPGEEILIDYGPEWEEAWREHAESWNPLPGSDDYVDAAVLNERHRRDDIRTLAEQASDPYPSNVQTSCYYDYVPDAGGERPADGSPRIVTHRWLHGMDEVGTNLRPCRILKREGGTSGEGGGLAERYTARILNCDETHHDALIPNDERVLVADIPRRAVVFTNRLYTTDMHLPNAFRHEMTIPDDIFPEAWKNL